MRRAIAFVSASLLLLAACSSGDDQASQGERRRAGKGGTSSNFAGEAKSGKAQAGTKSAAQAKEAAEQAAGSGTTTGSATAPQGFGEDAPTSGIDPSLARASASIEEPNPDAQKSGPVAPDYAEAMQATLQGLGNDVRFTMRFGGNLPSAVTKGQYMVLALGVTGRKEGQGYAIGATCDENGWKPYAGAKTKRMKFPGTFEISGNEMIFTVPWSFFEGPRAFEWYASTAWYQQVADQTQWSFDAVPNGRPGAFPGR